MLLADSRRALGDVTGSERSLADGTHRGAKRHAGFQVLRAADERDPLSNVSTGFDRCVGSGDQLERQHQRVRSRRDATLQRSHYPPQKRSRKL